MIENKKDATLTTTSKQHGDNTTFSNAVALREDIKLYRIFIFVCADVQTKQQQKRVSTKRIFPFKSQKYFYRFLLIFLAKIS